MFDSLKGLLGWLLSLAGAIVVVITLAALSGLFVAVFRAAFDFFTF